MNNNLPVINPLATNLSPIERQLLLEDEAQSNYFDKVINNHNRLAETNSMQLTHTHKLVLANLIRPAIDAIQLLKSQSKFHSDNNGELLKLVLQWMQPVALASHALQAIHMNVGNSVQEVAETLSKAVWIDVNAALGAKTVNSKIANFTELDKLLKYLGNQSAIRKNRVFREMIELNERRKDAGLATSADGKLILNADGDVSGLLCGIDEMTIALLPVVTSILTNMPVVKVPGCDTPDQIFFMSRHEDAKRDLYTVQAGEVYSALVEQAVLPNANAIRYNTLMVCKPNKWLDGKSYGGGYLRKPQPLVKRATREHLDRMAQEGWNKPIIDTCNILQEQRFVVNKFVLKVAQDQFALQSNRFENTWGFKFLPKEKLTREDKPLLLQHAGEKRMALIAGMTQEELRVAKREQAEHLSIYSRKSITKTLSLMELTRARIEYAEKMADEPFLYQAWNVDFRTRAYCSAALINSQGDDFTRSLLKPAKALPLTEEQAVYLFIQCANTWANNKLDKAEASTKIAWVLENKDFIIQAGTDPLASMWWADADGGSSAWSFLAICEEVARWFKVGTAGLYHLDATADGKCNGIQWWAALTRNQSDAKLVGLSKHSTVNDDIYTAVAKVANELLANEQEQKERVLAELILKVTGGIGRSVAKHPVMTTPYGITTEGVRRQVFKSGSNFIAKFDSDVSTDVGMYTSGILMNATASVLKGAYGGMEFIRQIAKIANKKGLPLTWTTPDGYQVHQEYKKEQTLRVKSIAYGQVKIKKTVHDLIREKMMTLAKFTMADGTIVQKPQALATFKDANPAFFEMTYEEIAQFAESAMDYDAIIEMARRRCAVSGINAPIGICIKFGDHLVKVIQNFTKPEMDGDKQSLRLSVKVEEDELSTSRQVLAIAPNFIHSLDASHMRAIVKRAHEQGIEVRVIHDSFGCHPSHYETLYAIIRETFVEIAQVDQLERFIDEQVTRGVLTQEERDAIVAEYLIQGNFDVTEVLEAPYAFA